MFVESYAGTLFRYGIFAPGSYKSERIKEVVEDRVENLATVNFVLKAEFGGSIAAA